MSTTHPQKWLVMASGGIAAYKVPELVRLLKKQGHEVRVVLSSGAKAFVTPMTLQAVSGHPVYSELLDTDFEAAMGHIELARWATGILIAPLSANRLAALALGLADDLLSTICLATTAPIWVAPSMNQQMYHHTATQQHLATLKQRGVRILGPDFGEQACGEVGPGRMVEPSALCEQIGAAGRETTRLLEGLTVVVTAGPTREAIDPVRYLSNRSSGKMGYALAQVAYEMGANVVLISGPVSLPTPVGVSRVDVVSAKQMCEASLKHSDGANVFIGAAAVADFAPHEFYSEKLKKHKEGTLSLTLTPTPDIIREVAKRHPTLFCCGFAAETQHLEKYALQKLKEKKLDLIALNDVSRQDIGFDATENALTVYSALTKHTLSKQSKEQVAFALLNIISEYYHEKYPTQSARSSTREGIPAT